MSIGFRRQRVLDWMLKDLGDAAELGAKMKAQWQERDRLKVELATLPKGTNIVAHPASIKAFAEKLRVASPKLEVALALPKDMGELCRLIRDVIQSITLYRDDDGRLSMEVTSWLEPFLKGEEMVEKAGLSAGVGSLVAGEGLEPPTPGL